MLEIDAAAVALKLAVVFPDVTVTDAGTVSNPLLLPSVTVVPPVGAAEEMVTVHALTALCPRLVGLQDTLETRIGACRLMVAV